MPVYMELFSKSRKNFDRPMLLRMRELYNQGLPFNAIAEALNNEFYTQIYSTNVRDEVAFMKAGPKRYGTWNPEMEQMVINEWNAGKDVADITTELFHRYAKPAMWQETYRKVQQMIATGRIA